MRVLTLSESITDISERLRDELKRPVYVASCLRGIGTHYKKPGETEYRSLGNLELYLSAFTDGAFCVKRESAANGDKFLYDLSPSLVLRFVFTVQKIEVRNPIYAHPAFDKVSLKGALNTYDVIPISADEEVPEELKPYVGEYRTRRGKVQAVQFAKSEAVLRPDFRRETWHRGTKITPTFDGKPAGIPFVTIQPPGQYSDIAMGGTEDFNRLVITDEIPGACVVCRGSRHESRHVGVLAFEGSPYATGLICNGCAKESFDQILQLLEDPKPI